MSLSLNHAKNIEPIWLKFDWINGKKAAKLTVAMSHSPSDKKNIKVASEILVFAQTISLDQGMSSGT